MKKLLFALIGLFLSYNLVYAAQTGKVIGGENHDAPSWFKLSFLDITEDAQEAYDSNKHLMIFLDLDGCPYCAKMLTESFSSKNRVSDFIKTNFDVIKMRITGTKEITWDENSVMSEKEFAKKMQIYFTPTMLFLDKDKKIVARVDGYRSKVNFLPILEYVQGKYYEKMELGDFLDKLEKKNLYTLKPNKLFTSINDLSKISTPLAVIYEDGSCTQCEYLHDVTFQNKDVKNELKKYTIVRLDATSKKPIIDVYGHKTTPQKLARELKSTYRPTLILYNKNKERLSIDALLYSYHLKERLRYVSGEYYNKYPTYREYSRMRKKELLQKGVTIDLAH